MCIKTLFSKKILFLSKKVQAIFPLKLLFDQSSLNAKAVHFDKKFGQTFFGKYAKDILLS